MTAKEFLKQYEYAEKRAQRLREMYQTQHEKIDAISSTLGGDGTPHGSGVSRKTEDMAIKLADSALKWKEAELDALRIKGKVFELICGIPDIEGEVLYERYVNLHSWEEVCVIIHRSWTGTHKAHRRALAIVQDLLDKRV